MHRFHIDGTQIMEKRALLSKEEAAHALRVLRLKDGSPIEALDGHDAWKAVLRVTVDGAYAELLEKMTSTEAPVDVALFMGIPKGEKLELIAQKLTELGSTRVVPVRMERCVAKIETKDAEKKLARLRKIASEAMKQCGRTEEMAIDEPVSVAEAAKRISDYELGLMLWEEARGYRLTDAHAETPDARSIAYIVGPEGGISAREAEVFTGAGAKSVTLGPRILRAETAAVAGCAVIMNLWGDL